jgi:hypothetical protein
VVTTELAHRVARVVEASMVVARPAVGVVAGRTVAEAVEAAVTTEAACRLRSLVAEQKRIMPQ